jgi:hypothetical protein
VDVADSSCITIASVPQTRRGGIRSIVNIDVAVRGTMSNVEHPEHYGGEDDPYEAIKVVEAWGLGFHLGNVVKYIARAGKKGDELEDLQKARWYLDRAIANLEKTETQ